MFKTDKLPVDTDLKKVRHLRSPAHEAQTLIPKLALASLFLLVVGLFTLTGLVPEGQNNWVIAATLIGGYMAMNIGANDVANTMGPAVGSKALTVFQALVIAAFFNFAGALIAGGDVVSTVSKGIIDISIIQDAQTFIIIMVAALLSAALWVNLATLLNAPVSTTHAIVGGVAGAGLAAAGSAAVNWPMVSRIIASWLVSPLMGGLLAAAILFAIKTLILFKEDKVTASQKWVPVFIALMSAIFSVYLVMKGLKRLWQPGQFYLIGQGVMVFVATWAWARPRIYKAAQGLENKNKAVGDLFKIPLIFATCLLAFAHGANDVSNAVGPLAGVISAVQSGGMQTKATVPLWILATGGIGIGIGIYLFGIKLMQAVGKKITRLNIIRAYCVALAAATTVIIASAFGLPVSSTHVAIGGIFGVGFLREYLTNRGGTKGAVAANGAPLSQKKRKKAHKRKLVRRRFFLTIIGAWIITVPGAAVLGTGFFFILRAVSAL